MTEICRSEPVAVSSQSSIRFKPYVLWRSGMLAFADLSSLVPQATWELLDRSAKGRESRLELADQLADRLYVIIPRLAPDERRDLLQLRRDLHNDRLPRSAALTLLENKLDDSGRQLLDQWRQSRLADEEIRAAATDRLVVDLETARKRLKEVATTEYFLRGIQLSGSGLYRDVRSYLNREQPAARPFSKKLRQTENTIIRYAYRMSLRTSPFGCFTEIGAQPWLPAASTENSGERKHVVTLSRGLLTWMVYELRRIEGSEQFLMLRLNNTLQRVDNQFEAFTRGMDGGSNAYWGESFIKVQGIGPVALIIQTLAGGPQLKSEVVNRFVERNIPADKALTFIDGLIKAGVCHQDLALPDQITSFAGEVAARLRTVPTEPAARCADVFERLQQIETELALANAEHREELLEELMAQVERFSDICGVPPPPVVSRSFVFEDVAAAQHSARSFYPEILEKNTDHFSRLLRLLPVFDDATYERLGLYQWFTSRFGERGHREDLLALYGEFSEQSDSDISAIMQATHDPHAQQCRSLEREILKGLDRAVEEAADGPTLQLDPRCVDELAASVSDVLRPWEEAAFRLQIVPKNSDSPAFVVLNDAMAGHGIFFSRFCDLVEPSNADEWSLRRVIRDSMAIDHPHQADLTAVLALNVNLHPRLTPKEIVYPGSVATGSENVLTLRDLSVIADPDQHTLRLVNRHDGQPVDLTPMNFLFPAAAPRLYRFLCALAPLHSYRSGLWDRLQSWSSRNLTYLPRLMLGDLVLERRCWFLPLAAIKELGDGSDVETLTSLLATQEWAQRHNLPRECFFQIHELVEDVEAGNWLDATRRWALNARTARRKGQYVDFRNPFLVRLLLKQAARIENGIVFFQETLPPTGIYSGNSSLKSAEEFVIEMRTENRAASNYGEMA